MIVSVNPPQVLFDDAVTGDATGPERNVNVIDTNFENVELGRRLPLCITACHSRWRAESNHHEQLIDDQAHERQYRSVAARREPAHMRHQMNRVNSRRDALAR